MKDFLSVMEFLKWKLFLVCVVEGRLFKEGGDKFLVEIYRIRKMFYFFSLIVGKWNVLYDLEMYYMI